MKRAGGGVDLTPWGCSRRAVPGENPDTVPGVARLSALSVGVGGRSGGLAFSGGFAAPSLSSAMAAQWGFGP